MAIFRRGVDDNPCTHIESLNQTTAFGRSSECVTPLVSGPMAHRYPHRHATLREQYHARDRYRLVPEWAVCTENLIHI